MQLKLSYEPMGSVMKKVKLQIYLSLLTTLKF